MTRIALPISLGKSPHICPHTHGGKLRKHLACSLRGFPRPNPSILTHVGPGGKISAEKEPSTLLLIGLRLSHH